MVIAAVVVLLYGVEDEADVSPPRPHRAMRLIGLDADDMVSAHIENGRQAACGHRVGVIEVRGRVDIREYLESHLFGTVAAAGEIAEDPRVEIAALRHRLEAHHGAELLQTHFSLPLPLLKGGDIFQGMVADAPGDARVVIPEC